MPAFLATLLRCSVAMSVISFVYMAAMPHLAKRYSATWLYYIWLFVIIGWIFPFWPHINQNVIPLPIPEIPVIELKHFNMDESIRVASGMGQNSLISLWWIISGIWGICTAGIIAYNVWRHKRFIDLVNRWGEAVENRSIFNILDSLRAEMKIRKHVDLKTCPFISSPMLVGFFRPVILLPSIEMDPEELTFILRHELIHFKRHDLWHKSLILLTTAVHWFNPAVYIIAKAIEVQCELSCDELVVKETSMEQRKRYSETIIGLIKKGSKVQTALSTHFYREGYSIKTRIFRIMDNTKKEAGITIFFVALMTIMGSRMVFANTPVNHETASIQTGQAAARDANNVQVIDVNIKSLASKELVRLEGKYSFEAGDVIHYNILTEGYNEELTIKLVRENHKEAGAQKAWMVVPEQGIEVSQDQTGGYYLMIYNKQGESLCNIKGTIEIIKKA
ncbi:MAG: hypothetical protein K0R57_659 [Paenibacillaceae bacterium]|jgi:beta-lactamase regulating signal transducer with metallopeptidase domain|nr:hypothetical protein [Paenibacillaceae bacterium]